MLPKCIAFEKSDPFSIVSVEKEQGLVTIHIKSNQKRSRCPVCRTYSRSIHSHYQRTLKDLPGFGNQTLLTLEVRRFYCHNKKCKRKVFTERFKEHFAPYSRHSKRLERRLLQVALLLGGNPGGRLCRTLNIKLSSSSLIRLIHKQKLQPVEKITVLGIDDWASKKRRSYGTCVVDLDKHKMVELLKDRESITIEKWLGKHPEVKVVSRDRYVNYAKGIGAGAPQAIQVGDRWHLLKNLGDALQKLLERNRQFLKYNRYKSVKLLTTSSQVDEDQAKRVSKDYAHRQWQMDQIKGLHQRGYSLKAIASTLQMARVTVRKYLTLQEPPQKSRSYVQVNIALFDGYLREWVLQVPGIEMLQLFKEIKEMGYNGGRSQAYEHLHKYVHRGLRAQPSRVSNTFFLPSKIKMLLVKRSEEVSQKEQKQLRRLCAKCPQIKLAHLLANQFRQMVEQRKAMNLKSWINKALQSNIPELISFARGILKDFDATENALSLPWSNGQVEGQINKLKTIKRQMYGRASFTLLRKRLLLDSS